MMSDLCFEFILYYLDIFIIKLLLEQDVLKKKKQSGTKLREIHLKWGFGYGEERYDGVLYTLLLSFESKKSERSSIFWYARTHQHNTSLRNLLWRPPTTHSGTVYWFRKSSYCSSISQANSYRIEARQGSDSQNLPERSDDWLCGQEIAGMWTGI